jgi:hypothetical protein
MRKLSRSLYDQLKELPVAVYNKRTQECVVVLISPEEGREVYEL